MAALFPGSIHDADYNTLGYIALQEAANKEGLKVSYTEKVAVSDAEKVIKNYIDSGYSIIWAHGAQFNDVVTKSAMKFKEVTFIMEIDEKVKEGLANIWYLDRNYTAGFYVLGALIGMKSEAGKIGYIGGLKLPFTIGQVNAVKQALNELNTNVELIYEFTGDFNDPSKTASIAEKMIAEGVDVIISSVNLGNFGLYRVVNEAAGPVFITTTYTDKSMHVPDRYLTSDLFSFRDIITQIVHSIVQGQKGGKWKLEYGEGKSRHTQFPLHNVSNEIALKIREISKDIALGKITVDIRFDKILE